MNLRLFLNVFALVFSFDSILLGESKDSETLIIGIPKVSEFTDPAFAKGAITVANLGLLHRTLVKVGAMGEVKSDLAKSWKFNRDFTLYTMCLEKSRFRSGRELELRDVIYSFKRIKTYKRDSVLSRILDAVDPQIALSENTQEPSLLCIDITLKSSFPDFLYVLVNPVFSIVPYNSAPESKDGLGSYTSTSLHSDDGNPIVEFVKVKDVEGLRKIRFQTVENVDVAAKMLDQEKIDIFIGVLDFQNIPKHGQKFKAEFLESLAVSHLSYNMKRNFLADNKELRFDLSQLIQNTVEKLTTKDEAFQFNPNFLPYLIIPHSNFSKYQNKSLTAEQFALKWGSVLKNRRLRMVGWTNELNSEITEGLKKILASAGCNFEYVYGYLEVAPKLEDSGDYEMMMVNQMAEFEKPESFFEVLFYKTLKNPRADLILNSYREKLDELRNILSNQARKEGYLKFSEDLRQEEVIVPLYRTRIPILISNRIALPATKFRYFFNLSRILKN